MSDTVIVLTKLEVHDVHVPYMDVFLRQPFLVCRATFNESVVLVFGWSSSYFSKFSSMWQLVASYMIDQQIQSWRV